MENLKKMSKEIETYKRIAKIGVELQMIQLSLADISPKYEFKRKTKSFQLVVEQEQDKILNKLKVALSKEELDEICNHTNETALALDYITDVIFNFKQNNHLFKAITKHINL